MRRRPRPGLQAGPAREASKSAQALLPVHTRPCDARSRGPPHNSLRDLRSLRSTKCGESVDEARCARGHEPCASRRLTGAPKPARTRLCQEAVASCLETPKRCIAAGGTRQGRFLGRREAQPWGRRAQRAPELTRRVWSNEANAVSEVSYAARPQGEHRSAVGVFRRPPQHEPLPGTACRDAQTSQQSRRQRTAAADRKRINP